jgi:glycosyltransferase involved in cell wall biosynthesis
MISVCMASFNGSLYIEAQIKSILKQLDINDELIIVDDHSSDNTRKIINSFRDQRIKLIKNKINMGSTFSFNKALMNCKGDLIFLSDQDDEWKLNKVNFIKNFFNKNNVDLVVHNATIKYDHAEDNLSLFDKIKSSDGLLKNIYSNTFTGCCMVFKKKILDYSLPIPIMKGIYHDAWIGINAKILKSNIKFINNNLVIYNRHSMNLSSMKRRSLIKIIPERINLIIYLFIKYFYKKYL